MNRIPGVQAVRAIADSVKARRLVIFAGAGVSMLAPSRSPSWWEIYVAAARALAARFGEGFPHLSGDLQLEQLLAPLQTQQLADLIFSRFAGETFTELLRVVDIADPNENHELIAALDAINGLRAVLTTNFDTLFERAAAVRGRAYRVVIPFMGQAIHSVAKTTPLIKIHGTAIEPTTLIETSSHKARAIDPDLINAWHDHVSGADLLVIGYSGADLNFGAAKRFFADFLAANSTSGRRIWWLHRPDSLPTLTDAVTARAELIEGSLPELLRSVVTEVAAERISVPVSGSDAQSALRQEMDRWSRELHINKWSAAVFFFALGDLHDRSLRNPVKAHGERFKGSALQTGLKALALEAARRCEPGSKLDVTAIAMGGFLNCAGLFALSELETTDAQQILRAGVNLANAMDVALGDAAESRAERHMVLSSAWGNFGHALSLGGKRAQAEAAFQKSLSHAYAGGIAGSFLIALGNIVDSRLANRSIRLAIQLLEGGICIADRIGAVQSSIEFRMRLAGYHIERHELWSAARELDEALRRAASVHDEVFASAIRGLQAHIVIRRGRFREGLEALRAWREELGSVTYLSGAFFGIGQTVDILSGVEGSTAGKLDADEVERIVKLADLEVCAAGREKRAPWMGRLFSIDESACLNQQDAQMLFTLGRLELKGDTEGATALGINLAGTLLNAKYPRDASWAARNVLANPHASNLRQALARTLLATANADLGLLGDVLPHLEHAKSVYKKAGERLPLGATVTGLWYCIQSYDVLHAIEWAGEFVEAITDVTGTVAFATTTVLQIDSWGELMAPVARALRERFAVRFGWILQAPSGAPAAEPYRQFLGSSAELRAQSSEEAQCIAQLAQEQIAKGDADAALTTLDALSSQPLSDHTMGVSLSLLIAALNITNRAANINALMEDQREQLLSQLAFSALARLESSLLRAAMKDDDLLLAARIIENHSFIADLCADPRAAATLHFWEVSVPAARTVTEAQVLAAMISAKFYRTAESLLSDRAAVASTSETPAAHPNTSHIQRCYLEALTACSDPSQAVEALARALGELQTVGTIPLWAAIFRGEHANWLLRQRHFEHAIDAFREAERDFRAMNDLDHALNSMAGAARAQARSGRYADALVTFQSAINEARDHAMRANLLTGLAAAHVLEATEVRDPVDRSILDEAIKVFRTAIESAAADMTQRAMARLGLARAIGEKGDQEDALYELDRAIAELAHLGSPMARILIENHEQFETGAWRTLGLG